MEVQLLQAVGRGGSIGITTNHLPPFPRWVVAAGVEDLGPVGAADPGLAPVQVVAQGVEAEALGCASPPPPFFIRLTRPSRTLQTLSLFSHHSFSSYVPLSLGSICIACLLYLVPLEGLLCTCARNVIVRFNVKNPILVRRFAAKRVGGDRDSMRVFG